MAPTPRIIIAANRLPVQRARGLDGVRNGAWESSAGGLVTALVPVVRESGGTWVGWTGATGGKAPRAFTHDGIRIKPVAMSRLEEKQFYHGFSNSTLWPLYHDAIRTPEFHRDWWHAYVKVNQRFARTIAAFAKPGDGVWVQDYQLQLVPAMLRRMRPDLRIGFFLHIPFPPEELFAWLPWRRAILQGMLGADLVGFQTYAAVQNFARAARLYELAEGTDANLTVGGRNVRVAAVPISIDFDWFEREASRDETRRAAAEIRQRIGPSRKILLAVDRMDYTKGIELRLRAFEEMLARGTVHADDCVLVQIAVPSREAVGDYVKMRGQVERTVGRINGTHSSPGRVAVHYFRRNLTREELTAYYRAADVMLVTPLRDGMNLVAKEFLACRTENDGVLVLSEFAGAARELRRTLIVNPRDIDGMMSAIGTALSMSRRAQRMRMAILRMIVKRHDVHDWARRFLELLSE